MQAGGKKWMNATKKGGGGLKESKCRRWVRLAGVGVNGTRSMSSIYKV